MNIVKHSFALSFALAVSAVYAAYGALMHFMPHMYVRFYSQLLHVHDQIVAIPSLELVAMGTVQVFVLCFIAAFLFAFVHNTCSECCCRK